MNSPTTAICSYSIFLDLRHVMGSCSPCIMWIDSFLQLPLFVINFRLYSAQFPLIPRNFAGQYAIYFGRHAPLESARQLSASALQPMGLQHEQPSVPKNDLTARVLDTPAIRPTPAPVNLQVRGMISHDFTWFYMIFFDEFTSPGWDALSLHDFT
jgi:hypothetical protein